MQSHLGPGNRTGSLQGPNFVLFSNGKFPRARPGWNPKLSTTKIVEHKLASLATTASLWILVTLLIKQIGILLKTQKLPFWPLCWEIEATLSKNFRPGQLGGSAKFNGKRFIPVTEISAAVSAQLIDLVWAEKYELLMQSYRFKMAWPSNQQVVWCRLKNTVIKRRRNTFVFYIGSWRGNKCYSHIYIILLGYILC